MFIKSQFVRTTINEQYEFLYRHCNIVWDLPQLFNHSNCIFFIYGSEDTKPLLVFKGFCHARLQAVLEVLLLLTLTKMLEIYSRKFKFIFTRENGKLFV